MKGSGIGRRNIKGPRRQINITLFEDEGVALGVQIFFYWAA